MPDIDLLLLGGVIVGPNGRFRGNIGIESGKIVLISENWEPSAKEVIDLEGKIVTPGFIDSHVHFREPGITYKEDFTTGSQAAAAGGVTYVVDMPNTKPAVTSAERFLEKLEIIKNKSIVDFSLYTGGTNIDQIPALLDAGAIGIKLFMVADPKTGYPHDPELFTGDDGVLYEILKRVAEEGSFCSIHPANQEIFVHESKKTLESRQDNP